MKAIIFDLDGTLLDSIDDIADCMNDVLERYGLSRHSADEYKYFIGDGATILTRRAAAGAEAAGIPLSQIETEFKAEYSQRNTVKTAPYPGIAELLSALVDKDVKMAVFSNKPHDYTGDVVSHFFKGIKFVAVIGHRTGHPVKPDPGGVYEILDIMGIPKEEVLYVGDTGTDMQTAKAAGLTAVGALWGFREKAELEENGADYFIESPMELLVFF